MPVILPRQENAKPQLTDDSQASTSKKVKAIKAPAVVTPAVGFGFLRFVAPTPLKVEKPKREKAEAFLSSRAMSRNDAASVLSALAKISAARDKEQVLLLAAADLLYLTVWPAAWKTEAGTVTHGRERAIGALALVSFVGVIAINRCLIMPLKGY